MDRRIPRMAQTEVSARQVVASAPNDKRLRAPPLIERELRSALRKYKPERRRLAVAAAGFAAVLFVIYFGSPGRAGRQLHFFFCLAGIYFVITAPQRTAGIIAAERREQTLGLLFLSGLSALEIFLSKVCSGAMIVFTKAMAHYGGLGFLLHTALGWSSEDLIRAVPGSFGSISLSR